MPLNVSNKIADPQGIVKPTSKEMGLQKPMFDTDQIYRKDGAYMDFFLPGSDSQTAAKYGVIRTFYNPIEILWIAEVHSVAGSDGGAVTLDIEKLTGTTAPGSGTTILASTFNLKSTANTVVTKEGKALANNRQFKEGERIALKTSGTLTALEGVCVSMYYKTLGRGDYR